MRKVKKVKQTVEVEKTVDLLCNKCGETLSNAKRFHGSKDPTCGFSGLEEVEVHGGYDSQFVGDMTSWKFSVCEQCLSEFVKGFKIPHEIKGSYSSEYVPLEKYEKLTLKLDAIERKKSIDNVLNLCKSLNKKETKKTLSKKSNQELYDLFHNLLQEKRK